MVSVIPLAEQRMPWDSKSITNSLKRADSLRIQVSEVDLPLPEISRSVVLGNASERASTDVRPATAPSQVREDSTRDVSTQTADEGTDSEHLFSESFFSDLEGLFDTNPAEPYSARCMRCETTYEKLSTFAQEAITSSCGHAQRRTCPGCTIELLSKAGVESLQCGEEYCENAIIVNVYQIDLQMQKIEELEEDEDDAVYRTESFKKDLAKFSERLRTFESYNFYCIICGDQKSRATDRIQPEDSTTCDHESNCCLDCLRRSINSQFEDRMWDAITCPECVMPIDYAVVRKMVSEEQFQKYDRYLVTHSLQTEGTFRWCPHAGCGNGQFVSLSCKGNDWTVVCNSCEKTYCYDHREAHEGQTCRQYNRTSRLSRFLKRSDRVIWRTTKSCPGAGCSAKIEKNEGCSHMTCTMCRFEFCWICKIPYENVYVFGNRAHRWFCRHKLTRW